MINGTDLEKRIQQTYDGLTAESIQKFVELSKVYLKLYPNHNYSDVIANIIENVTKWRTITFKQFRAVFFFIDTF